MEAPVYRIAKRLTRRGYEVQVDPSGVKSWYLNGLLHRVDGPARVWPGGTKVWYLHGKEHREDGPAEEWPDGQELWFLNNSNVSEEEFKEVWECPLDRLPLYINTEFAPIAKRRLRENESLHR